MALADYRSKRRFADTPEPSGKTRRGSGALRFVVQKHHASRLHYDFRLEMDGVLKSWAVPKGPSLDPKDKRLAMMVEDHPFDYRTFEGTIPKGNYGAGTVMVWDEGTYTDWDENSRTKAQQTLLAGLKAGHITFKLRGKKLRGEFALVRSQGAGDNAWLLLKKGDEYADKIDITEQDRSVVSGRSLDQIASGQPGEAQLGDLLSAAPLGRPKSLKPMLATLAPEPFDRDGWIYEIKWDGYRIVAEVAAGQAKLTTRGDQDYTELYGPAAKDLISLPDCILDGEMVILDAQGKASFAGLQNYRRSGEGNLTYIVFDILSAAGRDLTKLPLLSRKHILRQLVVDTDHIRYSDHIETTGRKFFEAAKAQKLEGIMAKDGSSHYEAGRRSSSWLKLKTHQRQEAIICGYTEPRGGRKHLGALVLGVWRDGKLCYIGHTAGKLSDAALAELRQLLEPLERQDSPFAESPKVNAPVHWVEPQLVCEVSFTEWTPDGHMRHPIFEGMREDKTATEVEPEIIRTYRTQDSDQVITIDDHRLKMTHSDKRYWPEDGYTKGDLIEYYRNVAAVMVPHLRDRPQSMHRFPGGIHAPSFFQKDYQSAPDWATTYLSHSDSEERDLLYLVANDTATLLYMANLGCIEINPWLSTTTKPDHPSFCVIDLDPEGIGFEAVIEAAQVTHAVLESIGVPSYPKTSGATGLHIYIPLGGNYTYEQSKNFAHVIVSLVHAQLPDTTSIERSPAKRPNRIYLDYLQNRRGQTIASAYSVRPRPGATVSAPLDWKEVVPGLSPTQFTMANMPQRIKKVGDIFGPTLGKGIDLRAAIARLESI